MNIGAVTPKEHPSVASTKGLDILNILIFKYVLQQFKAHS